MTGLILAIVGFLLAVAAWTVALGRLRSMTGPVVVLVLSLAGTAVCTAAIVIAGVGLGR